LDTNPAVWFEKNCIGVNMVGKMLPELSEALGLPRLTNGQVMPRPSTSASKKQGPRPSTSASNQQEPRPSTSTDQHEHEHEQPEVHIEEPDDDDDDDTSEEHALCIMSQADKENHPENRKRSMDVFESLIRHEQQLAALYEIKTAKAHQSLANDHREASNKRMKLIQELLVQKKM
jgi:hypothetical protein